jgi:hypothetical protein
MPKQKQKNTVLLHLKTFALYLRLLMKEGIIENCINTYLFQRNGPFPYLSIHMMFLVFPES